MPDSRAMPRTLARPPVRTAVPAHPQRNGSQVQVAPPKPPIPPSSGEGESDAEGDPEAEEVDDPDADLLAAVDAAEASSGKGTIAPWVKREIEAA